MTLFQAIFLAVVQGITEFLPISSSGHLVLFQKLFHLSSPPVLFDVLLHFGTLGAILFFFRKEIFTLIGEWRKNLNIWVFLIVGSLPAVIFGFILNSQVEIIFNSLKLVGLMWLIFGTMLLLIGRIRKKEETLKEIKEVNSFDAVVIGLFQALALFPGISRSGSTLLGGFNRGFSRKASFTLSFLLAIPAILGATFLQLVQEAGKIDPGLGVISISISALVGYFTLKLLQRVLWHSKFYLFGLYCFILGLVVSLATLLVK